MSNKFNINDEINFNIIDEISVSDLIHALDNSKDFSLFEINENDNDNTDEKNILIKITKRGA